MLRIQPVRIGIHIHGQLMFLGNAVMARCMYALGNSGISAATGTGSGK
jgi:hypothetical protein